MMVSVTIDRVIVARDDSGHRAYYGPGLCQIPDSVFRLVSHIAGVEAVIEQPVEAEEPPLAPTKKTRGRPKKEENTAGPKNSEADDTG